MQVLTAWNRPYLVDSTDAKLEAKEYWTFSGPLLDFTLSKIFYLEEAFGDMFILNINDTKLVVPASWNIMVTDPHTFDVDTVPIADCTRNIFDAFLFCPEDAKQRTARIRISDLKAEEFAFYPQIPKDHMLCHPVGARTEKQPGKEAHAYPVAVLIGPADLHSKYLVGVSAQELLC